MKKLRKTGINYLIVIVSILFIASVFFIVNYLQSKQRKTDVDIAATTVDQTEVFSQVVGETTTEKTKPAEEKPAIPDKYLLKVPFQSQAPFGDWSEPYENACEEASIITVEHYLNNQALSKDEMKSEIDSAVAWQLANWGGHTDLNAEKTLKLAEDYFHLSGKVVKNYSLYDIKQYISKGLPVLAPSAGRKLGNPNFRGVGPEYHMLVIIGYDDSQGIFITNDPGTRKGESYIYKYETVLSAISGPKEDMAKEVVILSK